MTVFEKRLARSNARYSLLPRIDVLRATARTQSPASMTPPQGRKQAGAGGPTFRPPLQTRPAQSPEALSASPRFPLTRAIRPLGPRREEEARFLWLQLLQAHDLIQREVRRGFQDVATLPQFDVLVHLDRAPEGLTLADLSRRLLVTAGNLTGIVGRLERDRLVRREEDPADGRAFRVRLTLRGRHHVRKLVPRHTKLVSGLLGGLSPQDQDALRDLLARLRGDLERRTSTYPPVRDRGPETRRPR